jgi:hypothetical protein
VNATITYPDRLDEMSFAPLWRDLPALSEPLDPFDFRQRMAVYKLLIDRTNPRQIFGADNAMNIFWGYASQLEWQHRSGRLTSPDTPPGRITPESWWGSCNYALSILPLIAAMCAGTIPPLEILLPAGYPHKFAAGGGRAGAFVVPPAFDAGMSAWQDYFRQVETFPGGDVEPLRFASWRAHLLTITAASALYADDAARYSTAERSFGAGWIRMVDFLGVAAWRTDLNYMLEFGQGVLPERMMTDADRHGSIADMNAQTNANLKNIAQLGSQSPLRYGLSLWLWKRAMRTRQARAEAPKMLDATFNPTPQNLPERQRLTRYTFALRA